jgi:hypothetical protein
MIGIYVSLCWLGFKVGGRDLVEFNGVSDIKHL